MTHSIIENARSILDDEEKMKKFSALNNQPPEVLRALLERLMEKPEIAEEIEAYLNDPARSEELKAYRAGEEVGYSYGHESGFAKGAAVGALGVLSLAGLFFLKDRIDW